MNHALRELAAGGAPLHDHEIEDIKGECDILPEDLCELSIVFIKSPDGFRLDIEHSDDRVVEPERYRQRAHAVFDA